MRAEYHACNAWETLSFLFGQARVFRFTELDLFRPAP